MPDTIVGSCTLYARKKPKAHFYFPEIKYKVTIHITHINVMIKFSVLRISYRVRGLYRLGKTCYLHRLLSIIVLFA